MFSGVFIAEEVVGVGVKLLRDSTMTNVQTLLEAFLEMSLRSACFIDEAFSGKKNSWDHSSHVMNYQIMYSRNFGVLAVFPDEVNSKSIF